MEEAFWWVCFQSNQLPLCGIEATLTCNLKWVKYSLLRILKEILRCENETILVITVQEIFLHIFSHVRHSFLKLPYAYIYNIYIIPTCIKLNFFISSVKSHSSKSRSQWCCIAHAGPMLEGRHNKQDFLGLKKLWSFGRGFFNGSGFCWGQFALALYDSLYCNDNRLLIAEAKNVAKVVYRLKLTMDPPKNFWHPSKINLIL